MRFFLTAVLCGAALASCVVEEIVPGKSSSSAGAGGMDDGKVHPPGNSVHISETAACKQLKDVIVKQQTDFGCVGTLQDCPSFLRSQYQPQCMEYDAGSVAGCVDYFAKIKDCEELNKTDKCAVIPFAGSEPKGCP